MRLQVERLKQMSLRQAFFLLTLFGLLAAVAMAALLWTGCTALSARFPMGGVSITSEGVITELAKPTPEQLRLLRILDIVSLMGWILFPAAGLGLAGMLFYRWKLKKPIALLLEGTERIKSHDLDFTIAEPSSDELGQVCNAFETMRAELLRTNRELWRQAEERKRLNAAFAHDLRNPITVLKGSIRLLRQGTADEQTLERLESYTDRIEHYVEAMSSIQRLEQLPLKTSDAAWVTLRSELTETARLVAPELEVAISAPDAGTVRIDHGIFLTVAENLIGNAARYARQKIEISLAGEDGFLLLTVSDDGPGFPAELLENGSKPFARTEGNHFGMGLYSSNLLCLKHGGALRLENREGALAAATFQEMI